MKKPAIIFLTALLLLAISFIGYSRISQKGQENKILPSEVLLHKSDGSSIVINPSDPSYQEIVDRTSSIINNSILVPVEKQVKITIALEPATFAKDMDESDSIEIKPNQPLQIPEQKGESESDRVRFILTGRYEGIILLHSTRPSKYGVGWHSWGPARDGEEFWSLREFLGLPPRPAAATPALQQTTVQVSPQQTTESLNLNHGEALQKLGIKAVGFYKEYTAKPSTFHPVQLLVTTDACKKGGYDLTAYLEQNLTFTGYRTDVTYGEESLNVWTISSGSKIVCIYLSVRESSNMAPGIFSVNNPLLSFPSR